MKLMPWMASAATKINGIYYNLNSTTKVAEVTHDPSWTPMYTGSIVIPNTVIYGGVTYSVTSIGEDAFSGCSSLTSITIPNSVRSIGWGAFSGCSGLTSIAIPNSVTSIGRYTFDGCTRLNSVQITDLSAWCRIIFSYDLEYPSSNPLSIAHHLYLNGEEVKELVIPDGITRINSAAFYGCSGLTSVTIPNSATSIGEKAFYGCSGLTSVTIPNSVTSIGYWAFYGCSGLTSITIPNSVTSIAVEAFSGCSSLTSVTIPNSVTSIEGSVFSGCSSLTSVTIPNSVTSIGSGAFYGCSGLTSLNIPNSVTSIGSYAFSGCSGLTSVTIPNSVTSIGSSAFNSCSGLTSLNIPNSVTSIGSSAFYGCSKLSSVSIGKGIISVGAKAFANCPEIKEVYCYAKDVPTISNDTFEDSYYIKWATLYVPESSVDLYKASAWSQFGNIVGITGGNEGERCEKPVITLLANGKIKVESATEGATCVTNITASNAEPLSDGEISLNTPLIVYTITSYATKEGYDDSEVATATFRYEKAEGDMNGDGMLNITDVIHLVNMILGQ